MAVTLTIKMGSAVTQARLGAFSRTQPHNKTQAEIAQCDPVHIQRFPINVLLTY